MNITNNECKTKWIIFNSDKLYENGLVKYIFEIENKEDENNNIIVEESDDSDFECWDSEIKIEKTK